MAKFQVVRIPGAGNFPGGFVILAGFQVRTASSIHRKVRHGNEHPCRSEIGVTIPDVGPTKASGASIANPEHPELVRLKSSDGQQFEVAWRLAEVTLRDGC